MKVVNWIVVTLCISMATPCFADYQINFEKMFNQINTEALALKRQMSGFIHWDTGVELNTRITHQGPMDSSTLNEIFPSFINLHTDAHNFHDKWNTILQNTNTVLSLEESNPSMETFSNLLNQLEAPLERIDSSVTVVGNTILDLNGRSTSTGIREDLLSGLNEHEALAIVDDLSHKIATIRFDLVELRRTLENQIENADRSLTMDLSPLLATHPVQTRTLMATSLQDYVVSYEHVVQYETPPQNEKAVGMYIENRRVVRGGSGVGIRSTMLPNSPSDHPLQ